jgi:excisionase family DNA binding protein
MNDILTLTDVCQLLKLHRQTIRRKIKNGEIKFKNIGSEKKPDYRFKKEWIYEYLESE